MESHASCCNRVRPKPCRSCSIRPPCRTTIPRFTIGSPSRAGSRCWWGRPRAPSPPPVSSNWSDSWKSVVRIAIVSDIHGNRAAFEAVLADLRQTSPDLILHGGDLPHGGASPAEIGDRIRDLGWQGVVGNTDEMLFAPESLAEFASQLPHLQPLWTAIQEMAIATCETLGEERLAWLHDLPRVQ